MLTRAMILLLCLLPSTALASPAQFSPFTHSFSLSVEPAVLHLSVLPGATYQGALKLRNSGTVPVRIRASAFDFIPVDEHGGVKLLPRDGSISSSDPIVSAGWVKLPEGELSIAPGRTFSLPIVISVPPDASAGARSMAITLDDAGGSTHAELQSLVFLDIPGNARKDMAIADFSADNFFAGSAENVFRVRLINTGKTHIRPSGELVIRNMFGRVRGRFELSDANAMGTISPNSARAIEYHWKGGDKDGQGVNDFGLWFASLSLNDGELHVSDHATFLVLPWFSILIFICGLAISLTLLRRALALMRKNIDEGNESIIPLIFVTLAGLLMFVAIISSLFVVFRTQENGSLERIDMRQKMES